MAQNRFFPFVLLMAVISLAGACSSRGLGFDDPVGEVELVGELSVSSYAGGAIYSGRVRNTGMVRVDNVAYVVDLFDGQGGFLGSFSDIVAKIIEKVEGENFVNNSLEVNESGTFLIQTTVPLGRIARVEDRPAFTMAEFEEF